VKEEVSTRRTSTYLHITFKPPPPRDQPYLSSTSPSVRTVSEITASFGLDKPAQKQEQEPLLVQPGDDGGGASTIVMLDDHTIGQVFDD